MCCPAEKDSGSVLLHFAPDNFHVPFGWFLELKAYIHSNVERTGVV